jgi:hypothetical protein
MVAGQLEIPEPTKIFTSAYPALHAVVNSILDPKVTPAEGWQPSDVKTASSGSGDVLHTCVTKKATSSTYCPLRDTASSNV